jgi:hypothetical protein
MSFPLLFLLCLYPSVSSSFLTISPSLPFIFPFLSLFSVSLSLCPAVSSQPHCLSPIVSLPAFSSTFISPLNYLTPILPLSLCLLYPTVSPFCVFHTHAQCLPLSVFLSVSSPLCLPPSAFPIVLLYLFLSFPSIFLDLTLPPCLSICSSLSPLLFFLSVSFPVSAPRSPFPCVPHLCLSSLSLYLRISSYVSLAIVSHPMSPPLSLPSVSSPLSLPLCLFPLSLPFCI